MIIRVDPDQKAHYVLSHLDQSYLQINPLLSTPMGVDYVVNGFDMEVQSLVTHNAA